MIRTLPSYLVLASSPKISVSTWLQRDALFIHEVSEDALYHFPDCTVEKVLSFDFGSQENLEAYCYALPLLDVEGHREYCRQRMQNQAEAQRACAPFGIKAIHKWIQGGKEGSWVLYYQLMEKPVEECRKKLMSLQHNHEALLATKILRETTGCTFTELCPQTKRITL